MLLAVLLSSRLFAAPARAFRHRGKRAMSRLFCFSPSPVFVAMWLRARLQPVRLDMLPGARTQQHDTCAPALERLPTTTTCPGWFIVLP